MGLGLRIQRPRRIDAEPADGADEIGRRRDVKSQVEVLASRGKDVADGDWGGDPGKVAHHVHTPG